MDHAITTADAQQLTPQMAQAIDLIAEGKGVDDTCKALQIGRRMLSHWYSLPAFQRELAAARKVCGEALADGLLTVHDAERWPDVQRAKVWAENVRWILARRNREDYGDRLDVGVNVTVDLASALAAARARALPMCDPALIEDAEFVALAPPVAVGAPDKQSVPVPTAEEIEPPDIFS